MSVVDALRNREPLFSSLGVKVRVLTDEEYDLLLDVVEAAEGVEKGRDLVHPQDRLAFLLLLDNQTAALAALESAQGAERPETGAGA